MFRPQWQGVFEKYARSYARSQHWRVKNVLFDIDDVVQECAWKFCQLCKIYGDAIDNPAWFMALYKQALHHHFDRLALHDQRARAAKEAAREYAVQMAPDDGHLFETLAGASHELREVLRVIATAPIELLEMMLPSQPRLSAETERRISRSWFRLAKLDGHPREDLVAELKELCT